MYNDTLSKVFEVYAHSENINASFNVKSYMDAEKIFERLVESDVYEFIAITDTLTGELYAYCAKESDKISTKFTLWFANQN